MARRPTRNQAHSDIEEDDDDARNASQQTSVKKEKKGAKGASNGRTGHNASGAVKDDDDDDDGLIDVANFHNQPLTRDELPKLKGLAGDWDTMEKQITGNTQFIAEIAATVAESLSDDDSRKGLEALDTIMRDMLDVGAEMRANQQVLNNVYQELAQGQEISDAVSRYEIGIQTHVDGYALKTTRQKYAKDIHYIQFKQGIWDVKQPGQPMPPLSELLPREDGDDSDDDDDIEVGGVTQDYKCPLSLMPLENPWTSEVCGHSFTGDAIQDFFKGTRSAKKCPAAGCIRSFTLSQCKPDASLGKKVKAMLRRQQRREEDDSDADEVID